MGVDIYFPALSSNTFIEGPSGFYLFPTTLIENPVGSGLYDIPGYLVSEGGDLYSIPLDLLGSAEASTSNIKTFSVQEDATPIEPSSSFGGVGQIQIGLDDFENAPRLIGQVVLTDGSRGKTSGNIRSLSVTDGALQITADSVLGLFNTDRTALPFVGTLRNAIQYYCDLVGIQNDVVVDTTVASRSVIYPGWVGNAWVYLKQLLSKEQVEMALVFDRVYVRPLRQLVANQNKMVSSGWNVDNSNAAKTVEVYYYNNKTGTNLEVYPLTTEDPSIYSVNAGETITVTQKLNATLSSVNQPVMTTFVNNTSYAGTAGVYSVVGNDNLPITAAQWNAQGGKVRVRITDDPSIIEIDITGASMTKYSPYRIAMSAGSSSDYNSLHITGTGVTWDKKMVTLITGATDATTSTEVGVTVDNPFVSTLADAYNLGVKTAQAYAGINYTVNGSAYDLNRNGEGNALIQATIADFNAAVTPGTTIATFNSTWAGQAISDFNEYWNEQVASLWENQLFGNAPGARVLEKEANFRITSATTTEGTVQFNASLDTLVKDFNDKWAGAVTTVYTNQITNPSFETVTTGWTASSGGTMTRQTTGGLYGPAYVRETSTGTASYGILGNTFSVTAGEAFSLSAWIRGTVGRTLQLRLTWTGATATLNTATAMASTTTWQQITFTGTVPVGATAVRVDVLMSGTIVSGNYFDMDGVLYLRGATNNFAYFDGSTTNTVVGATATTYAWTGAANVSTSTKTAVVRKSIADFNVQFAGMTMKDFAVVPLRKDF